jgi:hypothetical protein
MIFSVQSKFTRDSDRAFAQEAIAGGTIREKLGPESFECHRTAVPSQKRIGTSFCVVNAKATPVG